MNELWGFLTSDLIVSVDPDTGEVHWSLNLLEGIVLICAYIAIFAALGWLARSWLA